jgi:LmbE family N-acetylglucosaminyl deacetylase
MKALCLVAHPDDCIIFGYGYIHAHPEHDWTIGYLTYTEQDPRGTEISQFWNRRGIKCVFLGFEDNANAIERQLHTQWRDRRMRQRQWHNHEAEHACWNLACGYDLILTHNEDGDYGHLHHKLVYNSVAQHHRVIQFSQYREKTVTYTVPPDTYRLDEVPLHSEIIGSFHPVEHQNSYKESQ